MFAPHPRCIRVRTDSRSWWDGGKYKQEYAPGSSKPAKRNKEAKRAKGSAARGAKVVTMSPPMENKAAFPTLEEHLCWPTVTGDAESGR
jgi:hypothetical protein